MMFKSNVQDSHPTATVGHRFQVPLEHRFRWQVEVRGWVVQNEANKEEACAVLVILEIT